MTSGRYIAAGLYLMPALLWIVISRRHLAYLRTTSPSSLAFRLFPVVSVVLAVHYIVLALASLVPSVPLRPYEMIGRPTHAIREVPWLIVLALLRHILFLLPLPERRPSRGWLLRNYGFAGTIVIAALALRLGPDASAERQILAHRLYEMAFVVLGGLCLWALTRSVRPGLSGPEHAGEIRRPDLVMIKVGTLGAFAVFPIAWFIVGPSAASVGFEVVLGIAIALPTAMRMLGVVVVETATLVVLIAVTGIVVAALAASVASLDPSLRPALILAAVLALCLLLTIGQSAIRSLVARLVLRQNEHQWRRLQAFLHALSPEAGIMESCRAALGELTRVRGLPGAAILLADGRSIVAGAFRLEPIAHVWPTGPAATSLPSGAFGSEQLRMLPVELRDALAEANVGLGAATIESPRRRWGHLFMSTGFLGGFFLEEDADRLMAFTDQLALLLDAIDLLARTVAVERSLAHAEKLAAIGELAARVAHDIRNPVTAARSLAQQLGRDPTSPLNAEHATLIVEELERVERQVRDLLRFARRDELRLEPVDVSALLEATVAQLRPRLEAAAIRTTLAAPAAVVARGDREKLRQVVINLIENAIDALGPQRGSGCIALSVASQNGHVRLRVADDGPGVAAADVSRLFEPFFSTKEHGTGLGLAIVRRTIEAHGGRIEASAAVEGGLAMTIELPAAAEGAA